MNWEAILATMLAIAVVIACARLLLWQRRAGSNDRARGWRLGLLLAAQPVSAVLLYLVLAPPPPTTTAGTLIFATRGAGMTGTLGRGDRLVALPEAPPLPGADRVPDLATALRRAGPVRSLRIIGEGLVPRDRGAATGHAITFDPPAPPRGIVRLATPRAIAPGAAFTNSGTVVGVDGGSASLIDPAGRAVDRTPIGGDGRFVLSATARAAGPASFGLRIDDARHARVEVAEVPVWTAAAPPPRVLVLAGAPSAETKFLRRWAEDTGLPLRLQMAVGAGITLGDATTPIDGASLRRIDVAVLDERSWAALGAGAKRALTSAVRDGLGLMLRVTGPVPTQTRAEWRALGLPMPQDGESAPLRLPTGPTDTDMLRARIGPGTPDAPIDLIDDPALPELTQSPSRGAAADALPLLRDASGDAVGIWRQVGRGRVALWPIQDSFRLALGGRPDRYGELWSSTFATLARPLDANAPIIDDPAPRTGQRTTLCGLLAGAKVIAPGGRVSPLLPDPPGGACAGFWPRLPGWHHIRQPRAADAAAFFVFPEAAMPGIAATDTREATLRLAATPIQPASASPRTTDDGHGASWPWFIAWLIFSAGLWWFERSPLGRSHAKPEQG